MAEYLYCVINSATNQGFHRLYYPGSFWVIQRLPVHHSESACVHGSKHSRKLISGKFIRNNFKPCMTPLLMKKPMTVLQDFAVFTCLLLFCIFTATGPNANPRLLIIPPLFQSAGGPSIADVNRNYYRSFLPYIHLFFGY